MGPSKTTPTTGWSVVKRSADQQRLPRCGRAQDSSFSQQPRCVLIAPHFSSRSSTRWWGRLRSAGPAAPPPMNLTPARHLPPATLGWQAPGDLAMLPALRDHGGGGGASNKIISSRWRSRLRSAGHSALPPADCQELAACDTRVAGPRRSTSSLGGLVYFGEAGGGDDGSGSDSSGAPCAAVPPLRSGSGLLRQAVGTRLVLVRSQSAAH